MDMALILCPELNSTISKIRNQLSLASLFVGDKPPDSGGSHAIIKRAYI